MKFWTILALVALVLACGCSSNSTAPAPEANSQPKTIEAEPGKAGATTSNQELQINPNAGEVNKAGSALDKK